MLPSILTSLDQKSVDISTFLIVVRPLGPPVSEFALVRIYGFKLLPQRRALPLYWRRDSDILPVRAR